MSASRRKRLVLLSGPSCAGKGPLREALKRLHPEIKIAEPLLLHSRRARLKRATGQYERHGVDYYFLPRGAFAGLDPERFVVIKIRSELQAIDLDEVRALLESNSLVLTEAYYSLARGVMEWAARQDDLDFDVRSVSLLPLSDDEVAQRVAATGKTPEQVLYDEMKPKLIRRGEDAPDKIEERAGLAWSEMTYAKDYSRQIVNHAGEDDVEEWSDPLGPEASRVLAEFVDALTGDQP